MYLQGFYNKAGIVNRELYSKKQALLGPVFWMDFRTEILNGSLSVCLACLICVVTFLKSNVSGRYLLKLHDILYLTV